MIDPFSSYDAWKMREPDVIEHPCQVCGEPVEEEISGDYLTGLAQLMGELAPRSIFGRSWICDACADSEDDRRAANEAHARDPEAGDHIDV